MSDLTSETVKQACDKWYGMDMDEGLEPESTFVEAAGRWAKGTPIQWCEEHNAESVPNHGYQIDECWRVRWADLDLDHAPCRLVERRLCE